MIPFGSAIHQRLSNTLAPAVLLSTLIYLYLILFTISGTPLDTSFGDDNLFLNEATRILQGQIIYRDFFEFNFAGTQLFYALLIRLLGYRIWIPNACLIGLGAALFWTSILISRQLMTGSLVFLPGLLFLCLSFRNYLDASHHWYSALSIMVATAVLVTRRSDARLALAGALCGLALCFSPTHGILAAAGIAIFVLWEHRADGIDGARIARRELYFLLPVVSILVAYVIYFTITAGLHNLLFCTVIFPFKYWSKSECNGWSLYVVIEVVHRVLLHQFRGIWRIIFIALLLPGIYIASIARYLFQTSPPPEKELKTVILLTIVGGCLFASVVNSANVARLSTVSLPGLILLIWLIKSTKWAIKELRAFFWITVCLLMIRDTWIAQTRGLFRFVAPSGQIALSSHNDERWYHWLVQNTRPSDYVFDTDGTGIYFRFDLRNPTELPYVTACDITRPEQVEDVVEDLTKLKVRLIVFDGSLDNAKCPPAADHLLRLREYLRSHYDKVAMFRDTHFGTISIFERFENPH